MLEKDLNIYGKRNRLDRKPGGEVVTPTTQRFTEKDGSDVRMSRVRVLDLDGAVIHSYLVDPMGQRFVDNLSNTEDDLDYLKNL
ncbi:hypothetical protein E3I18_00905 [Candidatus Woesebacteria bacterium]|nr:MAG: hypothetical protein E3I18_00905 [Candidatus Woesebacteria bacterium]